MEDLNFTKIILELENNFKSLKISNENVLILSQKAVGLCSAVLIEMKETVKKNDFQSEKEEIYFFKKIKPQGYSKLIFYHTLFKIETKRPKTKLLQEKYLKRVLKKLHKYFKLNEDVCQYYWSEKEYNDELYFLRKNRNIAIPTDTLFSYIDHEFSTLHDYTFSCIIAHEQLIKYIENEIHKLHNQNFNPESKIKYTWTDSKIALIELIYALHSSGSVNNGKIDIKELVELFEKLFHIDLKEHSRTFIDIRMRKTEQIKFLDNLKQSLLKRMEEADG
ncbi:MAG: RteC domain-containing protein [Bacteroidota bacterium]